jgi:hypothetical protein
VLSAALPDVQLTVSIATKTAPKQSAKQLSKHHSDAPTVLHTLATIGHSTATSTTAYSDSATATAQQQRCIGKHFAAVACAAPTAVMTGLHCRVADDPLVNRYDNGHVTGHVIVPLCTTSDGSSLGVLEAAHFTTAQYEVHVTS